MRKRSLVVLATLFFILSFTFIPISNADTSSQSISTELRDAFLKLNSLSGEMTEAANELKVTIGEFNDSKPADLSKTITLYDPGTEQKKTWTTQQLDDAQIALDSTFTKIETLYTKMRVVFGEIETLLEDPTLPGALLTKHQQFVAEYEKKFEELSTLYEGTRLSQMDLMPNKSIVSLNDDSIDKDVTARLTIEKNISNIVDKLVVDSSIDSTEVTPKRPPPHENVLMEERSPKTGGTHAPAYLLASQGVGGAPIAPPAAEDLLQTIDTEMIDELTDLAATLGHDPVKIYEWVRNNIYYQPYYGSAKGAGKTYFDRAGNDFDTASLLIALLRESGIHSRYVYGTVRITADQANNMFGTDSAVTAAAILARGGIPVEWDGFDMLIERVWVEAYVPYDNYLGTQGSPQSGYTWLPLDPSFKTYDITDGLQVADYAVPDWKQFWRDFFENGLTEDTASEIYRTKIEEYLLANHPGNTIDDVPITRTIIPETLSILPLSLPYEVESVHAEYSEIPDPIRHKVKFKLLESEDDIPFDAPTTFDVTLDTVDIACKRLTIETVGATPADQAILDSFGSIYLTPLYLVDVKLALMRNGVIIASSDPVPGDGSGEFYLRRYSILPDGVTVAGTGDEKDGTFGITKLRVFTYAPTAVGISFNGFSDEYLQKQEDALSPGTTYETFDDKFGQIVYLNAVSTYNRAYKSDKLVCDLRHVAYYPNQGIFGVTMMKPDISSFMGGAISVRPKSFMTDIVLGNWTMTPLHNENIDWDITKVMGCSGSQIEGFVYRDTYKMPAASAVVAIQFAYQVGATVINGWTDDDPLTEDIYGPTIQYNDWLGKGTIKKGLGGGYLISGGYNGAETGEFGVAFEPDTVTALLHDPGLKAYGILYTWDTSYYELDISAELFDANDELVNNFYWNTNGNSLKDMVFPFCTVEDPCTPDRHIAEFSIGSLPMVCNGSGNCDYRLEVSVTHESISGIEEATLTITVEDPPAAGDDDVVFTGTDLPTPDGTPDTDGNIFVTVDDFTLTGWAFEHDGSDSGSGKDHIIEIWKDGELLIDSTTGDIITSLRDLVDGVYGTFLSGVYTIYYKDNDGNIKMMTIYVIEQITFSEYLSVIPEPDQFVSFFDTTKGIPSFKDGFLVEDNEIKVRYIGPNPDTESPNIVKVIIKEVGVPEVGSIELELELQSSNIYEGVFTVVSGNTTGTNQLAHIQTYDQIEVYPVFSSNIKDTVMASMVESPPSNAFSDNLGTQLEQGENGAFPLILGNIQKADDTYTIGPNIWHPNGDPIAIPISDITVPGEYIAYYTVEYGDGSSNVFWALVNIIDKTSDSVFTNPTNDPVAPLSNGSIIIPYNEIANWKLEYYPYLQVYKDGILQDGIAQLSDIGIPDIADAAGNYLIFFPNGASINWVRVLVSGITFSKYKSTVTNKYYEFDGAGNSKRGFLRNDDTIEIVYVDDGTYPDSTITVSVINSSLTPPQPPLIVELNETGTDTHIFVGEFQITASDDTTKMRIVNESTLEITYNSQTIKLEVDIAEIAALDAAFTKRYNDTGTTPTGICNKYYSPEAGHKLRKALKDNSNFESPISNSAQEESPFLLTGDPSSNSSIDHYMALRTRNAFRSNQDAHISPPPTSDPSYNPHDCSTDHQEYWQSWVQNVAGKADILYLTGHGSPGSVSGKTLVDQIFNIPGYTEEYSCGYEGGCFTFISDETSTYTERLLFHPFIAHDNNLDLEWIILYSCDVFKSNTSDDTEIAREWANLLLDSPSSPGTYANPIHGLIGNRGTAPLNPSYDISEKFEENLRKGTSIMLSWAQACIDVSYIDIDAAADVNSSLNAAFIVRKLNEDDALPPHGTMTEDTDINNIINYYIDYAAEYDSLGEPRIQRPRPQDPPTLLIGMPKVTKSSIGLPY